MSSSMSSKVKGTAKVSLPSSTQQSHAPRQQTGATPGGSNAISGRVRASTNVTIPAREVQGHAPPTPYPYNRPTPAGADTHISDPIRGDLGKLTPSLASGIRRVVGTK